jgi:hypothetical protein
LSALPKAHLTAVDTWEGSDEDKGRDTLNLAEKRFDSNLERYKDRLEKYKGSSYSFFQTCEDKFDFVYIDGSHHADDVMCDAIKAFERLRVGGVLIFDDYLWRHYKLPSDNPAGAINAFLKMKCGTYELLAVYHQVAIRKTKESLFSKVDYA